MKELFELSLNPWVLPFTVSLALCCLYWLMALLGTIDMDMFDLDIDLDTDTDIDGAVGNSGGLFASFLQFINATDVPLMLVLSVISICKWFLNIAALVTYNQDGVWWIALLTWLGAFIVSCVITALVTRPLIPLFKAFKAGEDDEEPIIGREAKVVTSTLTEDFGQVRVLRERGSAALVHCKLASGGVPLKKGETLMIIAKEEGSSFYLGKKI